MSVSILQSPVHSTDDDESEAASKPEAVTVRTVVRALFGLWQLRMLLSVEPERGSEREPERGAAPARHTRLRLLLCFRRLRMSAPSRRTRHLVLSSAPSRHMSSRLSSSSAPSRHTDSALRRHSSPLSGSNRLLLLKLLPNCLLRHHGTNSLDPAPSRHIDFALRRHSSPLSGSNAMLLLKLLLRHHGTSCLFGSAPSRHTRRSSCRLRHHGTCVVVCAITAQLSFLILSPCLPAGP